MFGAAPGLNDGAVLMESQQLYARFRRHQRIGELSSRRHPVKKEVLIKADHFDNRVEPLCRRLAKPIRPSFSACDAS